MHLETRTSYLVLHDAADRKNRRIGIHDTIPHATKGWSPGSRLSPVWSVKGFDCSANAFKGEQTLLFIGPVQPALIFASVQGLSDAHDAGVWLTAGCFCVVIRLSAEVGGSALADRITSWATDQTISFERWHLDDGVIQQTDHYTSSAHSAQPAIQALAEAASKCSVSGLQTALQENVIVTATSLSRAAAIYPPIHEKLSQVAEASRAIIERHNKGEIGVLEMQSRLLSMNAAMSRFSSQAFSGIPPISGTECHFWVHSLLGTGSANLALAGLVDYIQKIIGEARLTERLESLHELTIKVPTKNDLVTDAALLDFDLLKETASPSAEGVPIVPLVTYFSGRDGFSSQVQTLSAPLTTLAECNSYRSNLLTVTHEISHIFVQSALSVFSPTPGVEKDIEVAVAIAAPGFKARNHLEAARQLFIEAVIAMEAARPTIAATDYAKALPEAIERWRSEVQEILVHAFDFLYFHQGDPQFYVNSIWHSWCNIPGISDRVPEYLMRTLCSVSAALLNTATDTRFEAAVRSTRGLLDAIKPDIDSGSDYVQMAINRLERMASDSALRDAMEGDFYARSYLVRLVKIYLHSDLLAAELFNDPYQRSRSEGDDQKRLTYNVTAIGNGLKFLKGQLKANPTEAESLWVLHNLAYNLKEPQG